MIRRTGLPLRIGSWFLLLQMLSPGAVLGYTRDFTVPAGGGCPVAQRQNAGPGSPPIITGRVIPANRFALADFPPSSPGEYISGIFGAQVVAVDTSTGSVVAATLAGWSCDPTASAPVAQFDGSYRVGPLPVGRSYVIYAEPFNGIVQPGDIADAADSVCSPSGTAPCVPPAVNMNFAPRLRP